MTITRHLLVAGEPDHERTWLLVSLATLVLLGAVERVEPFQAFDLFCPWKAVTGWPCVTCGATRAVRALGGGAFLTALRLNPLVTLVVIAWAVWAAHAAAVWACGLRRWRVARSDGDLTAARWVAAASVAACWVFLVIDGR